MKNDLISIILPCYNTEKYLEKCIDSILNQTYQNIEVIIINDGSTDNSLSIINEYAKKDSRIAVINQENKGLATVRNIGIANATGDFITFIDSDDFVADDYCEVLLNAVKENNADIVICDVQRFTEGEDICSEIIQYEKQTFTSKEAIYNLIHDGDFYDFVAAKLYNRKVFKNVLFPAGRVYEDSSTIFKLYENSNKVTVINQKKYFYLVKRQDSITGSRYDLKKQNDNYLMIMDRYNYLSEKEPAMKDVVIAGCIRNMLTLVDRSYMSDQPQVTQSEIVNTAIERINQLLKVVDKNILFDILNRRKLARLFLLLENEEVYRENITKLC